MNERPAEYSKGSLSLMGTIAMGTGVMIGAGIMLLAFSIMTMLVVWGDRVPSIIGWL